MTCTLLHQGLLSEVEVKYKMSQCYLHLKEYREATTIVCEVVSPDYIRTVSFIDNKLEGDKFCLFIV